MQTAPPFDAEEAATRAFRAPSITTICAHRRGHSGVSLGFVLVENASALHANGAGVRPAIEVRYEEPLLRPGAATLFNDVADALFSETEI